MKTRKEATKKKTFVIRRMFPSSNYENEIEQNGEILPELICMCLLHYRKVVELSFDVGKNYSLNNKQLAIVLK